MSIAPRATPPFRADHVGSLLRPPELLTARAQFKQGTLAAEQLRAVEDDAIRAAVQLQQEVGLRAVTDGEFRRTYFHVDFLTQLDGVVEQGGLAVKFHKAEGEIDYAPPVMKVVDKVRHRQPIQRRDFEFLRSVTQATPKVTIPSPTMLHFRGGRAGISTQVYPELDEFYDDVAAAYAHELRSLAEAGCTYVQLDDTNLAYLCDERQRAGARQRGDDPDVLPRRYAALINAALAGRPKGMTVCVHLCRGNFRSSWAAEGGYEPVAEVLFNELQVDGYFLEYDDARSGDFAPLRHVPHDKIVVLGLVSTKVAALESKDDLKRRLEEAGRHLSLEQACLSPQCGFSSTVHGNDLAIRAQTEKLRLVVELANEVWGTS
jgi:5-methyltetrahydropteroyltriglutamate--homocysteine methyltransferase